MSIPGWLEKIDRAAFVFINKGCESPWLDPVMMAIRNPLTWIPFYLALFIYVLRKSKYKTIHFVTMSLISVAITDSVSARVLKPYFARLRPCADEQLQGIARSLVGCGGLYSFPSNHAANHFGLAACWFFSIFAMTGKKWYWLWLWAFLVGFAQIYVGKHFPLDIAAGALLGILVGSICGWGFKKWAYPAQQQPRII